MLSGEKFKRATGPAINTYTGAEIYRYAHRTKGINSAASLRSKILEGGSETNTGGNSGISGDAEIGGTEKDGFSIGHPSHKHFPGVRKMIVGTIISSKPVV